MIQNEFDTVKIPAWKYTEIEKKVAFLYREMHINTLPLDPFDVIKQKGYKLIPFSMLGEDFCSRILQRGNDAFSFRNPQDGNFIIAYDDDKTLLRIRFTLMHELGHIELGHNGESELARKMADYYAGYALAPTPLIYKYDCKNIQSIMATFQVSKPCAEARWDRYSNWSSYYDAPTKRHEKEILKMFN